MKTKKCTKCLQVLSEDMFYKISKSDKCRSACKDCTNERARDLHQSKLESHSKRMKKHYAENKEYYQQKGARYSRSEKGIEVHRKSKEKYLSTDRGKEANRKAYKKYYQKNKEKLRAHWAVKSALLSGRLKRENCEECGHERSEAHHEDYSKKLEVIWLCRKHHKKRHRKIHVEE